MNGDAANGCRVVSRGQRAPQSILELQPARSVERIEIGEDYAEHRLSLEPPQNVGFTHRGGHGLDQRRPDRRTIHDEAIVQRHEHDDERLVGAIDAVPVPDQTSSEQLCAEHVRRRCPDGPRRRLCSRAVGTTRSSTG